MKVHQLLMKKSKKGNLSERTKKIIVLGKQQRILHYMSTVPKIPKIPKIPAFGKIRPDNSDNIFAVADNENIQNPGKVK